MTKYREWIAILLIGAVQGGVSLVRVNEEYRPHLVVEMTSSTPSQAEVFFDGGSGFDPVLVRTAPVVADSYFEQVKLPLPRRNILALRLDPIKAPGIFTIRKMFVEAPDGKELATFDPARLAAFHEIASREVTAAGIRFQTTPDSLDSQLLLTLNPPLDLHRALPPWRAVWSAAICNLLLLLAEAFVLLNWRRIWQSRPIQSLDRWFAAIARRYSHPEFLVLNRWTLWFYAACAGTFLLLVAMDLNGSSLSIYHSLLGYGGVQEPLAGTPKLVRSDEWEYHSPDILNQVFRADPFEVSTSALGNHKVSLIGSLPVRHITALFRPQYWGFFLLPADYGFSFYWEAKWLLLVTGVFTLLLLLTRSQGLAIFGSFWFFFSQFTQWTYSWPSMLPEMVGLFCWTVVLFFYLTIGSRPSLLAAAAFLCSLCAVDFALCAYVPHLVPLCWVGVFLALGWFVALKRTILRPQGRLFRAAAIFGCVALASVVLLIFYKDARDAIAAIAATTYPGRRSLDGGAMTVAAFLSHFFALAESENGFPPTMGNICEASGFLWLAPVTLLCFRRIRSLTTIQKALLAGLWGAAALLLAWNLVPIPGRIGHWFFLDQSFAARTLPALGLINVAIVAITLSGRDDRKRQRLSFTEKLAFATTQAGGLLYFADRELGHVFSPYQIIGAAIWLGLLSALLLQGWRRAFAAAVLIPSILVFGLVNPLQRGLDVVTSSKLFQVVHQKPEFLRGKWLVYSKNTTVGGLFSAMGCDTYTDVRYLPDIDHFPVLQAHGIDTRVLNSLGHLAAIPLPAGAPSQAESPMTNMIYWKVSPFDPVLKEIGIRYLVFDSTPPAEVTARMKPLAEHVPGFWLYELP